MADDFESFLRGVTEQAPSEGPVSVPSGGGTDEFTKFLQGSGQSTPALAAPKKEPSFAEFLSQEAPPDDTTKHDLPETINRALARGWGQTKAIVPSLQAMHKEYTGDLPGAIDLAQKTKAELDTYGDSDWNLQNIHSASDFGMWVAEKLGEQGANLASMAVTGGIGGLAGRTLAETALQRGLMSQTAARALMLAGKNTPNEVVAGRAGLAGAGALSYPATTAMETAGTSQEQFETSQRQNQQDPNIPITTAPERSLTAGMAKGALELLAPLDVGRALLLPGRQLGKSTLGGTARLMADEGLTEGAQEAIDIYARKLQEPGYSYFKDGPTIMPSGWGEGMWRLAESTAAGGVVGGVVGAPLAHREQIQEKRSAVEKAKGLGFIVEGSEAPGTRTVIPPEATPPIDTIPHTGGDPQGLASIGPVTALRNLSLRLHPYQNQINVENSLAKTVNIPQEAGNENQKYVDLPPQSDKALIHWPEQYVNQLSPADQKKRATLLNKPNLTVITGGIIPPDRQPSIKDYTLQDIPSNDPRGDFLSIGPLLADLKLSESQQENMLDALDRSTPRYIQRLAEPLTVYRGAHKNDALTGYNAQSAQEEKYHGGVFLTPDQASAEAYSAQASRPNKYDRKGNLIPGPDSVVHQYDVTKPLAASHAEYDPAKHAGFHNRDSEIVLFDRTALEPRNEAGKAALASHFAANPTPVSNRIMTDTEIERHVALNVPQSQKLTWLRVDQRFLQPAAITAHLADLAPVNSERIFFLPETTPEQKVKALAAYPAALAGDQNAYDIATTNGLRVIPSRGAGFEYNGTLALKGLPVEDIKSTKRSVEVAWYDPVNRTLTPFTGNEEEIARNKPASGGILVSIDRNRLSKDDFDEHEDGSLQLKNPQDGSRGLTYGIMPAHADWIEMQEKQSKFLQGTASQSVITVPPADGSFPIARQLKGEVDKLLPAVDRIFKRLGIEGTINVDITSDPEVMRGGPEMWAELGWIRLPASEDWITAYRDLEMAAHNWIMHEVGHFVAFHYFKNLPTEIQQSLLYAQEKAKLANQMGNPGKILGNDLQATPLNRAYWSSLPEWLAEQFRRWTLSDLVPKTEVEKTFKEGSRKQEAFFREWEKTAGRNTIMDLTQPDHATSAVYSYLQEFTKTREGVRRSIQRRELQLSPADLLDSPALTMTANTVLAATESMTPMIPRDLAVHLRKYVNPGLLPEEMVSKVPGVYTRRQGKNADFVELALAALPTEEEFLGGASRVTLAEELVHAYIARGYFLPQEYALLLREAQANQAEILPAGELAQYKDHYGKVFRARGIPEEHIEALVQREVEGELVAHYVAHFANTGLAYGQESRGIMARLMEFIRKIRDHFAGLGYQTKEDLLRAIFKGEMVHRPDRQAENAEIQEFFAEGDAETQAIQNLIIAPDKVDVVKAFVNKFAETWEVHSDFGDMHVRVNKQHGIVQISNSGLSKNINKGQGHGLALYKAVVDKGLSEGYKVLSDQIVSEEASKMYEALKRRGYQVEGPNGKFEVDRAGRFYVAGPGIQSVFTITGGPQAVQNPSIFSKKVMHPASEGASLQQRLTEEARKKTGKYFPGLDAIWGEEILKRQNEGKQISQIAAELGLPLGTVTRISAEESRSKKFGLGGLQNPSLPPSEMVKADKHVEVEPGVMMHVSYFQGKEERNSQGRLYSKAVTYLFTQGDNLVGSAKLLNHGPKGFEVQGIQAQMAGRMTWAYQMLGHISKDTGIPLKNEENPFDSLLRPPAEITKAAMVVYKLWARMQGADARKILNSYVTQDGVANYFSPNHVKTMLSFYKLEAIRAKAPGYSGRYSPGQLRDFIDLYTKLYAKVEKDYYADERTKQLFSFPRSWERDEVQGSLIRSGQRADEAKLMGSLGFPAGNTSEAFGDNLVLKQQLSQGENARASGLPYDLSAPASMYSFHFGKYWSWASGMEGKPWLAKDLKNQKHEIDRIGRWMQKWISIKQLAQKNEGKLNPDGSFTPGHMPIQNYIQHIELAQLIGSKWHQIADGVMRLWDNGRNAERQQSLIDVFFGLNDMQYRTPAEQKAGVQRLPGLTGEWQSFLAGRPAVGELLAFFKSKNLKAVDWDIVRQVHNAFGGFLTEAEQKIAEKLTKKLASSPTVLAQALAKLQGDMATFRSKPYFPMMRFGQYTAAMRVGGKLVEVQSFGTQRERDAARSDLRKKYPTGELTIGTVPEHAIEFMSLPAPLLTQIKENLLDETKPGLTPDQISLMQNQKEWIAEFELLQDPDRSFRKRWLPAKGTAGYSLDAKRVFAHYFNSGSRYLSRLAYLEDLRGDINDARVLAAERGDGTKATKIADYMESHLNYYLEGGRDGGKFRAGVALWFLGFAPIAAAMNIIQPIQTGIPYLSGKNGFNFAKATFAWMKANEALGKNMGYGTGDPRFEKSREEMIRQEYITVGQGAELASYAEANNISKLRLGTKGQQFYRKLGSKGMWMFQGTEHYAREVMMHAAWHLAMENPGAKRLQHLDVIRLEEIADLMDRLKMSHQEALAFVYAKEAIDRSQFGYNRVSDPPIMRGSGKNFLIFFKFTQSMLFAFGHNGAFIQMMLISLFLYGLSGVPGSDDANELIRWLSKIAVKLGFASSELDLQESARSHVRALTKGTIFDETGPDLAMHGISRYGMGMGLMPGMWGVLGGFDASANGSIGKVIPGFADMMHGVNNGKDTSKTIADGVERAAGAGYGTIFAMMHALNDPGSADSKKWTAFIPRAFKGAYSAYRYGALNMIEGQTGLPVSIGNPPMAATNSMGAKIPGTTFDTMDWYDMATVFAQAMGATPRKVSQQWEALRAITDVEETFKARRSALMVQLDKTLLENNVPAREDVLTKIRKYDEEVSQSFPQFIIKGDQLASSLKQRQKQRGMMESLGIKNKAEFGTSQTIMENYPSAAAARVEKVK